MNANLKTINFASVRCIRGCFVVFGHGETGLLPSVRNSFFVPFVSEVSP
jgi:hypothetical protein